MSLNLHTADLDAPILEVTVGALATGCQVIGSAWIAPMWPPFLPKFLYMFDRWDYLTVDQCEEVGRLIRERYPNNEMSLRQFGVIVKEITDVSELILRPSRRNFPLAVLPRRSVG